MLCTTEDLLKAIEFHWNSDSYHSSRMRQFLYCDRKSIAKYYSRIVVIQPYFNILTVNFLDIVMRVSKSVRYTCINTILLFAFRGPFLNGISAWDSPVFLLIPPNIILYLVDKLTRANQWNQNDRSVFIVLNYSMLMFPSDYLSSAGLSSLHQENFTVLETLDKVSQWFRTLLERHWHNNS